MSSVPRSAGIYQITCTGNGKIYIGSAQNLEQRRRAHWKRLKGGYHENDYLQHAWNKYGADSFVFVIIEECNAECRLDREQYWLDTLQPCNREIGFNVSVKAGAPMAGRRHTPETLAKMSRSSTGRKHTEETRRMMSERNKGKVFSSIGVIDAKDWKHKPRKSQARFTPEEARRRVRESVIKSNKNRGLRNSGKNLLPGFEEIW